MAPVEIDTIPRDVVTASTVAPLKIVDKAFELPLVSDTYNEVTRLAQPLTPFVETAKENVEKLAPILESGFISMKNKAEEKFFPQLPEGTTVKIQAKLDTAMEKAASAVGSLDSFACVGLDHLTAQVPALTEATPVLMGTFKDNAVTYAGYAQEYVASLSISQIALKLSDKGLQLAADALMFSGLEETKTFKPVLKTIKDIRRNARAVRRAGAKAAGMKPARTIGEASLLGAVAEIVGLNFFLSVVGLQLVPANLLDNPTTSELDTTVEEETVDEKLSVERIATYVSDEDPDFVPGDVSSDSAEEDSEIDEVNEDDGVDGKVVEKVEEVVEEVVKEFEHVVEKVVEEIDELVELGAEKVEHLVEKVGDVVEEFLHDEHVVEEVVHDIDDAVEVTKEKIEDVVDEEADELENCIEESAGKIEKIVEEIAETIEDIEEVEEAFENVAKESVNVMEKIVDTVESITGHDNNEEDEDID